MRYTVFMNIHPLFVHFPIALLTLYALMECTPKRWVARLSWWEEAKLFLLAVGVLMALPTGITGDMASHAVRGMVDPNLVHRHAYFALSTVLVFLILLGAYLRRILEKYGWEDFVAKFGKIAVMLWHLKLRVAEFILMSPVRQLLALLGLVLLTITGALGASIVYGPNIDPIVSFIYHLVY